MVTRAAIEASTLVGLVAVTASTTSATTVASIGGTMTRCSASRIKALGNRPRAVAIPMIGQRRRMAIATASSSRWPRTSAWLGSVNTTRDDSPRPRHVLAVVEIVAVDQGHVARQQQAEEAPHRLRQIGVGHLDDDDGIGSNILASASRGFECPTQGDGNRRHVGGARGGGLRVVKRGPLSRSEASS